MAMDRRLKLQLSWQGPMKGVSILWGSQDGCCHELKKGWKYQDCQIIFITHDTVPIRLSATSN